MPERPWFQFYPSDWLGDTDLRACSLAARGLWADCLALMHAAKPRGYLIKNGKALDPENLALMVGRPLREVRSALEEIESAGVCSRTSDGALFSRRMVRDTQKQQRASLSGSLGGNPKLGASYNKPGYLYFIRRSADRFIKIGISADPGKRISKIRQQFPGQLIELIASSHVPDMGLCEAVAHARFAPARSPIGEWFDLPGMDERSLNGELARLIQESTSPQKDTGPVLLKENDSQTLKAALVSGVVVQNYSGFGPLRRHPLDTVDGVVPTVEVSERATGWLERFYRAIERHNGTPVPRRPDRDFTAAKTLVATYADVQLDALVETYVVATGPKFDGVPKSPGRLLDAAEMIAARLRKEGRWPSAA